VNDPTDETIPLLRPVFAYKGSSSKQIDCRRKLRRFGSLARAFRVILVWLRARVTVPRETSHCVDNPVERPRMTDYCEPAETPEISKPLEIGAESSNGGGRLIASADRIRILLDRPAEAKERSIVDKRRRHDGSLRMLHLHLGMSYRHSYIYLQKLLLSCANTEGA
jgi:hypothetical protein